MDRIRWQNLRGKHQEVNNMKFDEIIAGILIMSFLALLVMLIVINIVRIYHISP
jgi:hypothetical protein